MNDEIRKLLTTEVLEEKFMPGLVGYPYKHDGEVMSNRTFTTVNDAQALKDALVKMGKWDDFYLHAIGEFGQHRENYRQFFFGEDFTSWLWSYTTDDKGNRTGYRLLELAGSLFSR